MYAGPSIPGIIISGAIICALLALPIGIAVIFAVRRHRR